MRFLFSRLGRYLLMETLFAIGVTMACVSATVLLIDVVEELRTFGGRASISLLEAVGLTLLRAPQLIEQTLPFVVLVGTTIALVRLNRRSELIAIRAAGVSAWRFLSPTAVAALAIGAVATTTLDPAAARLYEEYERQADILSGQPPGGDGVWLRQGDGAQQVVIHAESADARTASLRNATLLFFDVRRDGALRFSRRMVAAQADLRSGFWQLRQVAETAPTEPMERHDELAIPTTLRQSALIERVVSPQTLSFWRLPYFIKEAKKAGLAPTQYELKWQGLLAVPAFLAAMAAIASVFSLRLQRLGGLSQMAGTGIALGFLLYFANRVIGAFAAGEAISPAVAVWAPAVVGFFGAMAVLSFFEDG
jgi:lipopolysaccharide export system permease protein